MSAALFNSQKKDRDKRHINFCGLFPLGAEVSVKTLCKVGNDWKYICVCRLFEKQLTEVSAHLMEKH